MTGSPLVSRRAVLAGAAGVTGVGVLAACGSPAGRLLTPSGTAVQATERARRHTGRTVTARLTPSAGRLDLGGVVVGLVALLRWTASPRPATPRPATPRPGTAGTGGPSAPDPARAVLDERLARGEIDEAEYRDRLTVLSGPAGPAVRS